MKFEKIIWKYWENKPGCEKPEYIKFVDESLKKHTSAKIIEVNPNNLHEYLPDINPNINKLKKIAQKSDVIRANLLYKYGGMWLDSDTLVVRNIDHLFDYLDDYEFVTYLENAKPRPLWKKLFKSIEESCKNFKITKWKDYGVSVNVLLSCKGSEVIEQWVNLQNQMLNSKWEFGWLDLGSRSLYPAYNNFKETVKLIEIMKVNPIEWFDHKLFFQDIKNIPNVNKDTLMFQLHNNVMPDEIKKMPIDEILSKNNLFARVLKFSRDGYKIEWE